MNYFLKLKQNLNDAKCIVVDIFAVTQTMILNSMNNSTTSLGNAIILPNLYSILHNNERICKKGNRWIEHHNNENMLRLTTENKRCARTEPNQTEPNRKEQDMDVHKRDETL